MPEEKTPLASEGFPMAPPHGFLEKMLDSMPRAVTGFVGSFLGIAIAFVIVMKMGGFEPILVRVGNAYAEGLETQMKSLGRETDKLSVISSSLTSLVARMEAVDKRVAAVEDRMIGTGAKVGALNAKVDSLDPTVTGLVGKVTTLSGKVERLTTWACDHVDAVKTRPAAPDCPTK